jgi:hypothetical protein
MLRRGREKGFALPNDYLSRNPIDMTTKRARIRKGNKKPATKASATANTSAKRKAVTAARIQAEARKAAALVKAAAKPSTSTKVAKKKTAAKAIAK